MFREDIVRDQGIWVYGLADITSVPDWQDFGMKFAEETTEWNATQSRWMNREDVMIFPYVEPSKYVLPLPFGVFFRSLLSKPQ